jgi:hypothetical protein
MHSFARSQGWWRSAGRVNAAAAYRDRAVPARISEHRFQRAQHLLQMASGRHAVPTFMRMLRDHGDAGGVWQPPDPVEEAYFATLCAHTQPIHWTTASLVAPLPRDPDPFWPVWVSFGSPCTALFLPVYVEGVIPAEFARGGESAEDDSAWWVLHALGAAASANPRRFTPMVREAWADLEGKMEMERPEVEAIAQAEAAARRPDAGAKIVSDFMQRCADRALDCARDLVARIH